MEWGGSAMRSLAPDRDRATVAVAAAVIVLAFPTAWGQIGAIILGFAAGVTMLHVNVPADHVSLPLKVGRTAGAVLLTVFFAILLGLPLLIAVVPNHSLELFEAFYRAGSLVFGGGHVVLPLLQASVVPPGWVSNDAFSPAMALRRRCPDRCSPSPPISAPSWGLSLIHISEPTRL